MIAGQESKFSKCRGVRGHRWKAWSQLQDVEACVKCIKFLEQPGVYALDRSFSTFLSTSQQLCSSRGGPARAGAGFVLASFRRPGQSKTSGRLAGCLALAGLSSGHFGNSLHRALWTSELGSALGSRLFWSFDVSASAHLRSMLATATRRHGDRASSPCRRQSKSDGPGRAEDCSWKREQTTLPHWVDLSQQPAASAWWRDLSRGFAFCALKHQVEGTVEVVSTDTVGSFARAHAAVSVAYQTCDLCSHRAWCRLRMQAGLLGVMDILQLHLRPVRDGPCGLQHVLLRDESLAGFRECGDAKDRSRSARRDPNGRRNGPRLRDSEQDDAPAWEFHTRHPVMAWVSRSRRKSQRW